jgi:hypothetical protein
MGFAGWPTLEPAVTEAITDRSSLADLVRQLKQLQPGSVVWNDA